MNQNIITKKTIFEYLKDNSLIITKEENKEYLLNEINHHIKNKLSLKFMTKEEFIKHLFFDYDDETIIYLMNKYNFKYDIAKMYLKNLYYLSYIEKNIDNQKLQELKNIKEDQTNSIPNIG